MYLSVVSLIRKKAYFDLPIDSGSFEDNQKTTVERVRQ